MVAPGVGIAPHDSVERYTDAGVDVFLGDGEFNASGDVCAEYYCFK